MVNKVILIGNLGRDPELTYTPSGVAVTKATLATTEKWKNKNGEKQESTQWHNLVFWQRSAEIANEYLSKGSQIYVEGSIQYRSWNGNDGQKRYATDIKVNNFQMLGKGAEPKQENKQSGGYGQQQETDLPF
jgi:single-strand DNA-binding protein